MARPLDFLKGEAWLASVGHFLGGYAVVLTAALWARSPVAVEWVTVALAAYVVVKEYVLDLLLESGETVASSTVDALGYALGAAVAWVEIVVRGVG